MIERLISVKDGAGTVLENYTLDKEGNRITSHLSSFHVINPANRLTEDQDNIYEYSLTGSLVTKSHKSDGITWRYDYNPIEQLIRARKYSGASLSDAVLSDMKYTYDGFGRLIDMSAIRSATPTPASSAVFTMARTWHGGRRATGSFTPAAIGSPMVQARMTLSLSRSL